MAEKGRDRTFNHHTYKPHKYGYDITPKKYLIGEGAYSMHPYFGDDYDLGIFCDVDPITRMKRIESREGLEKAKMFQNLWIPKEEAYFEKYQIAKGKIHYVYRDLSETREND